MSYQRTIFGDMTIKPNSIYKGRLTFEKIIEAAKKRQLSFPILIKYTTCEGKEADCWIIHKKVGESVPMMPIYVQYIIQPQFAASGEDYAHSAK